MLQQVDVEAQHGPTERLRAERQHRVGHLQSAEPLAGQIGERTADGTE